ncbi:hypothetical protein C2S42_01220 [Helicobacter pylori]|nr:hypothetical protein C2S42_01220 [Helicobacter pylori]
MLEYLHRKENEKKLKKRFLKNKIKEIVCKRLSCFCE